MHDVPGERLNGEVRAVAAQPGPRPLLAVDGVETAGDASGAPRRARLRPPPGPACRRRRRRRSRPGPSSGTSDRSRSSIRSSATVADPEDVADVAAVLEGRPHVVAGPHVRRRRGRARAARRRRCRGSSARRRPRANGAASKPHSGHGRSSTHVQFLVSGVIGIAPTIIGASSEGFRIYAGISTLTEQPSVMLRRKQDVLIRRWWCRPMSERTTVVRGRSTGRRPRAWRRWPTCSPATAISRRT